MAITRRGVGASGTGTSSISSLAQPTGTATGDVLLAFIVDHATSGNSAAPTGWQYRGGAAGSAGRLQVFSAVVGANGLSGTSWTFSGLTTRSMGQIVGYYNVDQTGYGGLDVAISARINASGTTGAPTISTTTAGAQIIAAFASLANSATWSGEAVATSPTIAEIIGADNANSTYCSLALADGLQTSSGPTGASSATMSTNAANGAVLVALRQLVTGTLAGATAAVTGDLEGTAGSGGGISVIGSSSNFAGANSVIINAPAGINNGDLLIASIYSDGTISDPAGWNTPGTDYVVGSDNLHLGYKVASSEPSSWTWTTAGGHISGGVIVLRGANTTTPLDQQGSGATGITGTATAPGITASSGALVLWQGGGWCYGPYVGFGTVSGMTEAWDINPDDSHWNEWRTGNALDYALISGATGNLSSTLTYTASNGWFCRMVSIAASGGQRLHRHPGGDAGAGNRGSGRGARSGGDGGRQFRPGHRGDQRYRPGARQFGRHSGAGYGGGGRGAWGVRDRDRGAGQYHRHGCRKGKGRRRFGRNLNSGYGSHFRCSWDSRDRSRKPGQHNRSDSRDTRRRGRLGRQLNRGYRNYQWDRLGSAGRYRHAGRKPGRNYRGYLRESGSNWKSLRQPVCPHRQRQR